MKGICPVCEKIVGLEHVNKKEIFNIRGENIEIDVDYFKCLECDGEFEDPKSENDPIEDAYIKYRKQNCMMQPYEIRDLRRRYGLTQIELSKLLGWGGATLSRYENGALQDQAHDNLLQLINNPQGMIRLIDKNGDFLPSNKRELLRRELSVAADDSCSFSDMFKQRYGNHSPDIYSGFLELTFNKIFEAVKFFAIKGEYKTKLLKLLFYSDFKHYKGHSVSITGAQYAHADHGPVPDNYEHYLATLIHDQKAIEIREVDLGNYVGEQLFSIIKPDLSIFSECELLTLALVRDTFKDFTATEMRSFSHKERGYQETSSGNIISFDYSDYLQI